MSEDRREEFERRLWWGYTKVGLRRIETGNFESALEPLFRALRLGGIDEERLTNIRVVQHDAVEVVAQMIPHDSLAAIHIFFPDPWPKKRHHKRRLLQPPFVHELAMRLRPGGRLHVATDWQDYAATILSTLEAEALLDNTAHDYAERPAYRPVTKFEQRGRGLGHGVWDMVFRR